MDGFVRGKVCEMVRGERPHVGIGGEEICVGREIEGCGIESRELGDRGGCVAGDFRKVGEASVLAGEFRGGEALNRVVSPGVRRACKSHERGITDAVPQAGGKRGEEEVAGAAVR